MRFKLKKAKAEHFKKVQVLKVGLLITALLCESMSIEVSSAVIQRNSFELQFSCPYSKWPFKITKSDKLIISKEGSTILESDSALKQTVIPLEIETDELEVETQNHENYFLVWANVLNSQEDASINDVRDNG
jgi:hypothetical protein